MDSTRCLTWWEKPVLWSDWQELERQALIMCQRTGETYKESKRTGMPDWWIEKVARSWYRAKRRYHRIKRGNEARKLEGIRRLLAEIGCE